MRIFTSFDCWLYLLILLNFDYLKVLVSDYTQYNLSDAKQRIMMILPILYALFFAIDATNDEVAMSSAQVLKQNF